MDLLQSPSREESRGFFRCDQKADSRILVFAFLPSSWRKWRHPLQAENDDDTAISQEKRGQEDARRKTFLKGTYIQYYIKSVPLPSKATPGLSMLQERDIPSNINKSIIPNRRSTFPSSCAEILWHRYCDNGQTFATEQILLLLSKLPDSLKVGGRT